MSKEGCTLKKESCYKVYDKYGMLVFGSESKLIAEKYCEENEITYKEEFFDDLPKKILVK